VPVARAAAQDDGDDRGHDHGHAHHHDHGHAHDHEAPPAPPPTAPRGADIPVTPIETPNPSARKFGCGRVVVETGSLSFQSAEEAVGHPLGRAVFAVPGVRGFFAVKDFVTVTKDAGASWEALEPQLVRAIQGVLAMR
jgi:hypothetical protein